MHIDTNVFVCMYVLYRSAESSISQKRCRIPSRPSSRPYTYVCVYVHEYIQISKELHLAKAVQDTVKTLLPQGAAVHGIKGELYICIFMYVCVCVYMFIYMCVYMYMHIYV